MWACGKFFRSLSHCFFILNSINELTLLITSKVLWKSGGVGRDRSPWLSLFAPDQDWAPVDNQITKVTAVTIHHWSGLGPPLRPAPWSLPLRSLSHLLFAPDQDWVPANACVGVGVDHHVPHFSPIIRTGPLLITKLPKSRHSLFAPDQYWSPVDNQITKVWYV